MCFIGLMTAPLFPRFGEYRLLSTSMPVIVIFGSSLYTFLCLKDKLRYKKTCLRAFKAAMLNFQDAGADQSANFASSRLFLFLEIARLRSAGHFFMCVLDHVIAERSVFCASMFKQHDGVPTQPVIKMRIFSGVKLKGWNVLEACMRFLPLENLMVEVPAA